MTQKKLEMIGYKKCYYGYDGDSDTKQCFHCKFGKTVESNREQVYCTKWKMVVGEEDICDSFEFATYWAFDCTDEDRERRRRKLDNAKKNLVVSGAKEGCYIATAVYGGYDKPEVMKLRIFRDSVLKKNCIGRLFIRIYYRISPQMAKSLPHHPYINHMIKKILDIFVADL